LHTIEITAPITTKFCTVTKTTKYSSWVVPTRVKQLLWRTAAILKIENRSYLWKGSTDLREIWYDDAFWHSEGYGQLKIPTFENSYCTRKIPTQIFSSVWCLILGQPN